MNDESGEHHPTVTVSTTALRHLLQAIIGSPHEIRELQATRGPMFKDNPIDVLVKQFNDQMSKEN